MTEEKKNRNLLLVILFLVILEAFLFYTSNLKLEKKEKIRIQEEIARMEEIRNTFASVPIFAKAVSVYDLSFQKEIYGKNQNEILPLASLSKTMTIINYLENYELDNFIEIRDVLGENSPNNSLVLGEKWKTEDLIKFTLISSSNDGALALSRGDKEFLFQMNFLTKKINLLNTEFFNFTGLDINNEKSGAYGNAFEMNLLAKYAISKYPHIFKATTLNEMTFNPKFGPVHRAINTNIILNKIPNVIFSKTGYTTLAGGNLTVIFKNKNGKEIAITLLGSTKEGRFTDMEKLVEKANNLNYNFNNASSK